MLISSDITKYLDPRILTFYRILFVTVAKHYLNIEIIQFTSTHFNAAKSQYNRR